MSKVKSVLRRGSKLHLIRGGLDAINFQEGMQLRLHKGVKRLRTHSGGRGTGRGGGRGAGDSLIGGKSLVRRVATTPTGTL